MTGRPDPKRPPRIRDAGEMRRIHLHREPCRACGAEGRSVHHLIPRSQGGDDVSGNLVTLCGDGATGCHGALHGSPYVVDRGALHGTERRDGEWVRRRIGERLRPIEFLYFGSKLGVEAGAEYLRRRYFLRLT